MKKLLLLTLTLLAFKTIAQPTFTSSDLNLSIGDAYTSTFADTSGINPGTSGANQTWVYNTVAINSPTFYKVVLPNSTPYFGLFPLANYVISDSTAPGNIGFGYMSYTNLSLKILGSVDLFLSNPLDTIVYPRPITFYKFPITYLSSFSDTSETIYMNDTSLSRSKTIYDAYGTLILNGQTYTNVLRSHQYDTLFSGASFQNKIYFERYKWIIKNYGSAICNNIFSITYRKNATTMTKGKLVYTRSLLSAALENHFSEDQILIYPNPANSELKIINGFKGTTTFEIKDLTGKTITSDQLNTIFKTIDIKALSEGMYILELKNKDKILTKKFVKR
jgi:hypothetical protein